jgi:syntaxin-binding protein 1
MIGESKASVRVKTLTEVNIDFLAIEQKAFSLNTQFDMKLAFGDTSDNRKNFVDEMANKLLTFCMTYGQLPYIRHSSKSNLATNVANSLHDKLAKLKSSSDDIKLESKNSVILIVDRGEDPLLPLLHDFYYQAMAFDLMKIGEDCIYTQEVEDKEKKVILDEYDPIWMLHRHTHFGELGPIIKKDFDAFMNEHKDINEKNKEKLKEGANLQNMIRKLPQYRVRQLFRY